MNCDVSVCLWLVFPRLIVDILCLFFPVWWQYIVEAPPPSPKKHNPPHPRDSSCRWIVLTHFGPFARNFFYHILFFSTQPKPRYFFSQRPEGRAYFPTDWKLVGDPGVRNPCPNYFLGIDLLSWLGSGHRTPPPPAGGVRHGPASFATETAWCHPKLIDSCRAAVTESASNLICRQVHILPCLFRISFFSPGVTELKISAKGQNVNFFKGFPLILGEFWVGGLVGRSTPLGWGAGVVGLGPRKCTPGCV